MALEGEPQATAAKRDLSGFGDIGRPIDSEWYARFREDFLELVADRDWDCRIPTLPGIVYTARRELIGLSEGFSLFGSVSGADEAVERLIRHNSIHTALAESGLRGIPVLRITSDSHTNSLSQSVRVRATLGDIKCLAYEGYVVNGERSVTERAAGVTRSTPRKPKALPEHSVTLATVVCPDHALDPVVNTLRQRFGRRERVRLGRLGVISSLPIEIVKPDSPQSTD